MKKLVVILLVCFIYSCGKDGETGPMGEQGIPGINGSAILSGRANPENSIGKVGDFYLNLTTSDLFGPKNETGWGSPFSIKGDNGEDGANGQDGSTILSGNVPPQSSVGKIGDFYIDLSNYTIYGPKSHSGWGNPVSLKSDSENGIVLYQIAPFFNQDFEVIQDSDNPYVWKFSASTKTFIIPDKNSKIIDFYYTKFHRLDPMPSFSFLNWKLMSPEESLGSFQIANEATLNDVVIKVEQNDMSLNLDDFEFKLSIAGWANFFNY